MPEETQIVLYDDPKIWKQLWPLTLTRPVSTLRCGIQQLDEKWARISGIKPSYLCESYLAQKWPDRRSEGSSLNIASHVIGNEPLWEELQKLEESQGLVFQGELIACRVTGSVERSARLELKEKLDLIDTELDVSMIKRPWDIFTLNDQQIREDFDRLTLQKSSEGLHESNTLIGPEDQLFIAPGAKVRAAILNTETGPIYIGEGAEVMEGAVIRGPFAACEHAVVKMASKVYGATTYGPYSKLGGEVSNTVVQGYSNKAHDGYLGNAVIGHWCNLGADSNNSNLKNNYTEVRAWAYDEEKFIPTCLQFCGLIMGDHSKCGINTMFNTGTVVGVSANIFGGDFPRTFIPSFSWGGSKGFITYKKEKAYEVADKVMQRRKKTFDDQEQAILDQIFELTSKYRRD